MVIVPTFEEREEFLCSGWLVVLLSRTTKLFIFELRQLNGTSSLLDF